MTTQYLSTLPKEALERLAKRWQSSQRSIAIAVVVWLGVVIGMVINKDLLLPNVSELGSQYQPALSDFTVAIGIFLAALALFIMVTSVVMKKTLNTVREVAAAHNVPFKTLLKETKRNQALLRQYV